MTHSFQRIWYWYCTIIIWKHYSSFKTIYFQFSWCLPHKREKTLFLRTTWPELIHCNFAFYVIHVLLYIMLQSGDISYWVLLSFPRWVFLLEFATLNRSWKLGWIHHLRVSTWPKQRLRHWFSAEPHKIARWKLASWTSSASKVAPGAENPRGGELVPFRLLETGL